MTLSVEWRVQDGSDSIVVVDPTTPRVTDVVIPDAVVLKDFLAVTGKLERWRKWTGWRSVNGEERNPEAWGELVIGRNDNGDVLEVFPELFWERVYRWFRSRRVDYNT